MFAHSLMRPDFHPTVTRRFDLVSALERAVHIEHLLAVPGVFKKHSRHDA